jgi:hypothetical protein
MYLLHQKWHYIVLLVFLCFQFPKDGTSQTFQYKIRVDEVDMQAPSSMPDGKIKILRDYDPNPIITGPAWKYPATEMPVAFLSGFAPMVTAKFDLGGCSKTIWAKGDGPGAFDLPAKQLSQGNYPSTALSSTFPSEKVDFYEPFEINWLISDSPNGPWVKAGSSKHPLYISHATTALSSDLQVYHSLIYYGCKSAKGLKTDDVIVESIYNGTFLSKKLLRKDSPTRLTGMTYWLPKSDPTSAPYPDCFTTQFLLKFEDGRCGAWADFFRDMIKIQGITATPALVTYPATPSMSAALTSDLSTFFGSSAGNIVIQDPMFFKGEFFVNNWSFSSAKFYKWDREWDPYMETTSPLTLPNGNVLNFAPLPGSAAQGNGNPQSTFGDHALVKYNNKYYDPSYGTPIQNSKNAWENLSLSGFGNGSNIVYLETFAGFTLKRRIMWLNEQNNPYLQSTIEP